MSATTSTTAPPPKPPTEAEIARARGNAEAAQLQAPRLRFDALVADLEADLEESEAAGRAAHDAGLTEEERVRDAARTCFGEEWSSEAVGHALQAVLDAEDEAERVRRLYEALRERSEAREARLRKVLWPLIEEWVKAHPPSKGKTTSFPSTLAKVVSKNYKEGKLEVAHEKKALAAIRAALGATAAWDVVKVEESVLVGAAREALVARGVDPAKLDGVKWTPPGDRLEIRRG